MSGENKQTTNKSTTSSQEFQKPINSLESKMKLAYLIPKIFGKIIARNAANGKNIRSNFDCNYKINIEFGLYFQRLMKFTEAESNTILYCLALIDKICETKEIYLTEKNVYKVFLAALVISIKVLEDETFYDKHYALSGGVSIKELAVLETEFLSILDYEIIIPEQKFFLYKKSFVC
jgi:hypothetical protein